MKLELDFFSMRKPTFTNSEMITSEDGLFLVQAFVIK